jgi:hypothetical protein
MFRDPLMHNNVAYGIPGSSAGYVARQITAATTGRVKSYIRELIKSIYKIFFIDECSLV